MLTRAESYIGTLIDDLVTKGTNEPYRIMTSRSEYRLYLRQDNAKARLMPKGHAVGLVSEEEYARFLADEKAVGDECDRLRRESIPASKELDALLVRRGYEATGTGIRKAELLKRPDVLISDIYALDGTQNVPDHIARRVCTEIKYEGYIRKQLAEIERFRALEEKLIPSWLDYNDIRGIRIEAKQKLIKQQPRSIGQASRISGVSPADISVLLIYLSGGNRND